MINKIVDFFREKILLLNDTPHKIALGLGLGVFAGVLPGTGPLAALALAFVFRANRAAALAGSLLTNTWISFVIFSASLQVGAFLTGKDWRVIYDQSRIAFGNFHWREIFSAGVWPIVKPILIGYFVSSLLLGIAVYLISLVGIFLYRRQAGSSQKKD